MMKIFLPMILLTLLITTVFAQGQYSIEGRLVNAENNKPIEGATIEFESILIKSKDQGYFKLTSSNSKINIVITHLGFQPRSIDIQHGEVHLISLEPLYVQMEEVFVNTGYQTISKEKSVGSFQSIPTEVLERTTSMDILSRIRDVSSSTFFTEKYTSSSYNGLGNSTPSLSVRGISTLRVDVMMPLIIVDNFPYEGDLMNINPNDVDNITILKDAAASSIWGARAGNGVIVITTKKGRIDDPLKVTFNTSLGITQRPNLLEDRLISSSDYIEFERFLFENGYYTNQENNRAKPAFTPVVELLIQNRDGLITDNELTSGINIHKDRDVRNDYLKYIYRNEQLRQYSLSVAGGSQKNTFNISAGYDENDYTLISNSYKRLSLRAFQQWKPNAKLNISTTLSYGNSRSEATGTSGGFAYNVLRVGSRNLYPYASFVDEEGQPTSIAKDYRVGFVKEQSNNGLLDWDYNPIKEANMEQRVLKADNILANATLDYKVLPSISFQLNYQYQTEIEKQNEVMGLEKYYTRNLINRYSSINDNEVGYVIPKEGILQTHDGRMFSHQGRGQFVFQKEWNNHQINALAGGEVRHRNNQSHGHLIYGYNDDKLMYNSNLDFIGRYPIYGNLAVNATIPNPVSFGDLTNRYVSIYSNLSYDYKNTYQLYMSARRDASNLFGVATNKKWAPLWSAGGAVNITQLLKEYPPWINNLKLRASYGTSGNVPNNLSAETILSFHPNSANYNVFLPYASIASPPNPLLRWEMVKTSNVGLNFGLFKNRITGSVDYYIKNTEDLLGSIPLDLTSGLASMTRNSGRTKSQGTDLELNFNTRIGAVLLMTSFVGSYNKNIVKDYYYNYSSSNQYLSTGITPVEGYMAYPVFSYKWDGLDKVDGSPLGIFNGESSKNYSDLTRNAPLEDLVYHGSARPLYFGAFRNSIKYNQLNLSFNISYFFDYYFRRSALNYNSLLNNGIGHAEYANRWQKPGDDNITDVPSFIYPINSQRENFYLGTDVLVERGDHIRLQDIRLDYEVISSRTKYGNLSLFGTAHNLGIIWRSNQLNLDPQTSGTINQPKSFTLGLKYIL